MTNCCKKCMNKFCNKRDTIEDCPECISEVYLEILKLNEKIKKQLENS